MVIPMWRVLVPKWSSLNSAACVVVGVAHLALLVVIVWAVSRSNFR
jgi:hypothetical protein